MNEATCISMPCMSSCEMLGNMYALFDVIVRFEIGRRASIKHNNNEDFDYNFDDAVGFHSKLVNSMSEEENKKFVSYFLWQILAEDKDESNSYEYSHVSEAQLPHKLLLSENGVKIELSQTTQFRKHPLKMLKTTGKFAVSQPESHVAPKIISLEDLSETHHTLILPIIRDKSGHKFPRQASFDLVIAISKLLPVVEMYFCKYNQNVDHVADYYLFMEFMLEMIERIQSVPTVLIDHILCNTGFKSSLIPFTFSTEFAQDIAKLHFSIFIANCIGVAKKQLDGISMSFNHEKCWLDPISTNIYELSCLSNEAGLEHIIRGNDDEIRVQKKSIIKYSLTLKSFLRTLGSSSHAGPIAKNLLKTKHGGVDKNSVQGSHVVSHKELKEMEARIDNLSLCGNYYPFFIYINILNSIARGGDYNKIICSDKVLSIPLETPSGSKLYKIPTQIFRTSQDFESGIIEVPIKEWQAVSFGNKRHRRR